jgi:hypothetical protein
MSNGVAKYNANYISKKKPRKTPNEVRGGYEAYIVDCNKD